MTVLEHHEIGDVDDKWEDGSWAVNLWDREPDGNPWFELIEFCKAKDIDPKKIIRDLDFSIYD